MSCRWQEFIQPSNLVLALLLLFSGSFADVHSFVPRRNPDFCLSARASGMVGNEIYSCYAYTMEEGVCLRVNTAAMYAEASKSVSCVVLLSVCFTAARMSGSCIVV